MRRLDGATKLQAENQVRESAIRREFTDFYRSRQPSPGSYGPCPVYSVKLGRDGSASWRGEAFTSRLGFYRGEIFEGDFENLAALIERLGFFDWGERYAEDLTDNPECVLEVVRRGMSKRVVQYATDEPPDFWTIATLIDGVASLIEWVPEHPKDEST